MEQKKTINKKLIAIIAGIAAIVCIAVAVPVIVLGGNSGKKLAEQLELAERYMDEMDYEAAIAAYEAAIEIDPKCEDAYLGLAEVYVALGGYEDAIKVLEDGCEATGSEEIQKRLEEIEELLEKMEEQEASANNSENQEETDGEENVSQSESGFVSWADAGLEDHVMDWQDANLELAMREITGITTGDIMLSDVWEITSLELDHRNIYNVEALGELTNLTNLYLYSNNISDISALGSLKNLVILELGSNNISDISVLSNMTKLEYLYLYSTDISNVGALGGLKNLIFLELSDNDISDYSPVSFVPELYY